MAYKAIFELEGDTYSVQDCNFSISQRTSEWGKPVSEVLNNRIHLEVTVDKAKITNLWKWAMISHKAVDGNIKFFKIDEDASLFELGFENGYCVDFSYHMNAGKNSDMTVKIEISAETVLVEGEGPDVSWTHVSGI